jgi:hypothetical protein
MTIVVNAHSLTNTPCPNDVITEIDASDKLHPVFALHRRMDIYTRRRTYPTDQRYPFQLTAKTLTNSTPERGRTHDILYVDLLVCPVQDLECDVGRSAEGELGSREGWEVGVLQGRGVSGGQRGGHGVIKREDGRTSITIFFSIITRNGNPSPKVLLCIPSRNFSCVAFHCSSRACRACVVPGCTAAADVDEVRPWRRESWTALSGWAVDS